MGIKITYNDGVVLDVKKSIEVGHVLCRAGGVRGDVEVDEIRGRAVELHPDPIGLQGAVVDVGEVKGGVGDGMVNKES